MLIELDPAEAQADAQAARQTRLESLAEVERRAYAIAVAGKISAAQSDAKAARGFERAIVDAAIADSDKGVGFEDLAAVGSTAGMTPVLGHLRSIVGLVWRSVVLWLVLLSLLTLARLLG